MKELFYVELGKRFEEIRQMEQNATPDETQVRHSRLIEIIDELAYLSHIGRRDGLLALEEAACEMDKKTYLNIMIMLIVDGTDPKLIEEICYMKYMANGYKVYEGLEYMMQMIGVLAIQRGENPRIIEERLLAMVPSEVEQIFRKREEDKIKSWYKQKIEELDMSKVEMLYEGELNSKIVEAGYPELEKLDYLLRYISDRSLQRALREVDIFYLQLAMKGLSGEGRHRVFSNMSKRLCVMVAEDMEKWGRGCKSDIGGAAQKFYYIFMKLIDCGEILAEESDEIYDLYHEYRDEIIKNSNNGSDDTIF